MLGCLVAVTFADCACDARGSSGIGRLKVSEGGDGKTLGDLGVRLPDILSASSSSVSNSSESGSKIGLLEKNDALLGDGDPIEVSGVREYAAILGEVNGEVYPCSPAMVTFDDKMNEELSPSD